MNKGNITISKRGNQVGSGYFSITINDEASGFRVCEVELGLSEFAEAISGLGHVPCNLPSTPTQYGVDRFGKKRVVENRFCDKVWNRDAQKEIVLEDFQKRFQDDGWELKDDGIRSQQNGELHKYTICKYVEG